MGLRDSHHIARVVDTDRQMGRAGLVINPPVGVVAEDRCQLCRFRQVGKGVPILRDKVIQRTRKLRVRRKGGDHSQKNSGAVLAGLAHGVILHHLGTAVIFAGQHRSAGRIIDHQVIGVRAGGGLVLRHAFLPIEANSPRFGAIHTGTVGQDGLHHCTAESRLGAVPIGGGHLDFLRHLVKGGGQAAVECEQL